MASQDPSPLEEVTQAAFHGVLQAPSAELRLAADLATPAGMDTSSPDAHRGRSTRS